MRLAQLLMKSGDNDEATALMSRITMEEKDPEAAVKSVDSMLHQENYAQALTVLQKLTRDQPKNWELLYREGVALAKSNEKEKIAEARSRFEAILAMKLNDDELSMAGKNQAKKLQGRTRSPVAQFRSMNPMMQRSQYSWQIRQAVGLDNQDYYGNQQQPLWTPHDFGTARMASFGWLNLLARNEGKEDEFLSQQRQLAEKAEGQRELTDWYYLSTLTHNSKDSYTILKKLSMRPNADVAIKSMYLSSLSGRGIEPGQEEAPVEPLAEGEVPDENQQYYPKVSALSSEEMEHVLACYKSIDDATSLMNYGQTFLQVVGMELKRCGRREEAAQLQKDAINGATQADQIAALLPGVVQTNDYETALTLLDRLNELKSDSSANQAQNPNTPFNYAQYVSTPEYQSQILAQLMAKRAQKKAVSEIPGLWDRYLTTAVNRYEQQKSPAAVAKRKTQQRNYQMQQRGYVYIWKGNSQHHENLDFPSANDVYDQATIQMLRQAYVIYKDAESPKDLLTHFQQKLADPNTPENQKIFWQFGLGYLHWWMDEKDEALAILSEATARLQDNLEMQFELARLHERRGEHDQALAIVDALTATDQQALQRREITALRLAVNSGNIERARTAAERLFGLRLDSNLQIQLAQQMHQLGMHEQAEAVLSRAGRQAGNKTDVLASLMQQYQSQGKNDVATQIAHQLLRRSVNNSSATMNAVARRRSVNQGDNGMRQQALTVLKRSGKLPEMIKKVEGQLKSSPKSQRLIETLIEYYTANGETKKVEELTARIAETKQDDPAFRYNLGQQLMQQGKHKEAVEHFKVALKKDPRLMRNNFYEIINSFQNADKMNDLAVIFDELDLKTFRQNPWELTNMISNMAYQEKTKDRAVDLFKRAWKELPDQRQQFLSNMNHDVFWQMPEIYDYARQGIIPTETSIQQNAGWPGFGQIQSWGSEGKITTLMNRFLTIATTNKKLDELTTEIEVAQQKVKRWEGAKALLALIDLRRGKVDEAKAVFEKLLPTIKGNQQGHYTHWEISQELMAHDKCIDLAVQYLEAACKDPDLMSQNEFQYTPGKPLMNLYKKQGRKDDARRVLVEAAKVKASRHRGNEDYEAYQRINNSNSLGNEMRSMGYPIDAIRVYQDQLARSDDFTAAVRVYGGGTSGTQQIERMKKQLETGFQTALKELKPELLPELLSGSKADAKDGSNSVDLLLILESRDLDRTHMTSALSSLFTAVASNPQMVEKTKAALVEIRSKSPDDLSTLILVAQLSKALNDTENNSAVVGQLVDLIDRVPLEPQPEKGSFTAKQREAAKQQIALWLVSRDCLKQEPLRTSGVKLGERALEAARRQTDHGFELAILREWGQLAIEAGDKETAERRWAEMLNVILPKPGDKPKKAEEAKTSWNIDGPKKGMSRVSPRPGFAGRGAGGEGIFRHELDRFAIRSGSWNREVQSASYQVDRSYQVTSSSPVKNGRPLTLTLSPQGRGEGTGADLRKLSRWEMMLAPVLMGQVTFTSSSAPPEATPAAKSGVVTVAQFEQATQVAKLAADHGLNDLSIQAMTMALQTGPPVDALQAIDPNQPFGTIRSTQQNNQPQTASKVEERLTVIERIWRQKGFPDEVVYDLLKSAVLPERRPFEVFLYTRPLNLAPNQPPQSIGSLLVLAAIRANKVDEVKALLEPKLKQPLGELGARVLLAQLALATRDLKLAAEQLEFLDKRLQQDTLQNSSELACHVAVPAMSLPELLPSSMGLFERAVDHFTQNALQGRGNVQEEPMRTYRFKLARAHFANQNPEAGKKHLEEYLNFLIPMYARYGGDYGQFRRRTETMKVAAEYARAGLQNELLDCLGRYADVPISQNYGRESAGRATATILAGIASLPAAQRYELLKAWSLPTPERNSVRMIGELIPGDQAPTSFDSLRGLAPRGPRSAQILSTADLLVATAAETKKLDELQAALQPAAEQNVENAAMLLTLIRIANGQQTEATAALQKLIEERKAMAVNQVRSQNQLPVSDLLIARAAIADPVLINSGRELARQFIAAALNTRDTALMSLARRESFSPFTGPTAADRMSDHPWDQGLKHWTAAMNTDARTEAAGTLPSLWITHEGLVSHVCGPGTSELYFKYPLTGEFTVTFDSWVGRFAEGAVGYGGVLFNALQLASQAEFTTLGNRADTVQKPPVSMKTDRFNRSRLEVKNDQIRYYANDMFIYSEPITSRTSPFLFLYGSREWNSAMANLRISGNPVIPRQVALSENDSLLGWISDYYVESRPLRDPTRVVVNPNGEPVAKTVEYDWSAKDGEIHGRYVPSSGLGNPGVQQSRIYYDRPLLDGERIQYEFWYEPGMGGVDVAPAMDRLAFLFSDQGVQLHWMTEGSLPEDAYAGLTPGNVLVDAAMQRGRVKLNPGDWNAVEVAVKQDMLSITLNGTVVAQRLLESDNRRQFGFYHDKNATSVRVRNVTLKGDWPETVTPEMLSDLLATTQPRTSQERQALRQSIEEKFHANGLDQFLLQTRSLPEEAQFERLKNWVVPNDDHASFRLYADFTPDSSLPAETQLTARIEPDPISQQATVRRQKLGGELFAPALDLVDLAKRLNRLDELSGLVSQAPAETPVAVRSQQALQILIAAAAKDFAKATTGIQQLQALTQSIPDDAPMADRWPEMVVGAEATRYPELRGAVLPLLSLVVDQQHKRGLGDAWEGRVTGLRDRCRTLIDSNRFPLAGELSPKGQWISSSIEWADAHGRGPVSRWQFHEQGVSHLAGYSHDYLYFNTPLRGSFTVEAEVATFGWRETRLMYNTQWVGPQYTRTVVELGNLTSSWTGPKIEPAIDFSDWCRLKLVVEPGKSTYFLNDRQVHEQILPDQPDPWVALMLWGNCSGGARMVRVSGQPEIPEQLDLTAGTNLTGWAANLYADPMSNNRNNEGEANNAWIKEGGEIVGRKFDANPGRKRQSLLRYHRPLVEDSVVNYDFFYVPNQTLAHPALGRLAFLLDPDGVKLHWLTDSIWETSNLTPDNVTVVQDERRGPAVLPLKPDDWNRLQLTLKGDTVTLKLNDVDVYETTLALTNQRQFGLFHYADETDVRVRNVSYRGDWPRTLPSLKDQELSGLGPKPYDFAEGELKTLAEWDFRRAIPNFMKPIGTIKPNAMETVDDGMKMIRGENAAPDAIRCGFTWETICSGDFEMTLDYRGFESKTEQQDWQIPRIELFLDIGGPFNTPENTHQMMAGIRRRPDRVLVPYSGHGTHTLDKYDWKYTTSEANAPSGRFRFVRKGDRAYYLFAKGDTDDWTLLNTGSISDGPLQGGDFSLRAEMPTSSGEAVFTRFTLKAQDPKQVASVKKPYEFGDGELTTKLTWDFQGPKPGFLKVFGVVKPNRMETLADGLKLIRPEKGTEEGRLCGFLWNTDVSGDLEATIAYRDFVSKTDQQDWQIPRLEAQFDIGGGWNDPENKNILQGGLRRQSDGKLILFGANRIRVDNDFQWKNNYRETTASAGRIRFVRKGEQAYYLHAKPDSDDWKLIYEGPVSKAPLKGGNFGLRSEIPSSSGEITLTEFVLKTAEPLK